MLLLYKKEIVNNCICIRVHILIYSRISEMVKKLKLGMYFPRGLRNRKEMDVYLFISTVEFLYNF